MMATSKDGFDRISEDAEILNRKPELGLQVVTWIFKHGLEKIDPAFCLWGGQSAWQRLEACWVAEVFENRLALLWVKYSV